MGHYSSLYCKIRLKPEFIPVIHRLYELEKKVWTATSMNRWAVLSAYYPQFSFLQLFADDHRANFIPFGALQSAPEEWDLKAKNAGIVEDIWTICCSVKTGTTIDHFLETVLFNVMDELFFCLQSDEDRQGEPYPRLLPNPPMAALAKDVKAALREEGIERTEKE